MPGMSSLGTVGVDAAGLYRMGGEGQAGGSLAVPADGSMCVRLVVESGGIVRGLRAARRRPRAPRLRRPPPWPAARLSGCGRRPSGIGDDASARSWRASFASGDDAPAARRARRRDMPPWPRPRGRPAGRHRRGPSAGPRRVRPPSPRGRPGRVLVRAAARARNAGWPRRTCPATSAVRPASSSRAGLRKIARARLLRHVVLPQAERHRSGSGHDRGRGSRPERRVDAAPAAGSMSWPWPRPVRRPIEQRRCGRWRLVGIGRPGRRARHPGEDRVDRARRVGHRSRGKATRLARAAESRRRLGCDQQRDRVLLVPTQRDRGRLAGTGQVARPPADLGQVDQPGRVEPTQPGQRLELGAGEGQRAEPQVGVGQDQFDAPAGWPCRDGSGSRSCRQPEAGLEPAQVAGRRDGRETQDVVAEQLSGQTLDGRRIDRLRPPRAPRRVSAHGRAAPPARRSRTRRGGCRPCAVRGRRPDSAWPSRAPSPGRARRATGRARRGSPRGRPAARPDRPLPRPPAPRRRRSRRARTTRHRRGRAPRERTGTAGCSCRRRGRR